MMNTRVVEWPLNSADVLGFDTTETPDRAGADLLYAAGLRFAVLYVNKLTRAQIEDHLGAGIALMFAAYARTQGWSAQTGADDGLYARGKLRALAVPDEATLWCDLEGRFPDGPTCAAYGNGWHAGAGGPASDPGVYIGAGVPLSSSELFHELAFRRYWRSLSQVPNVDTRGYQLVQHYPDDQVIAGTKVDLDTIQSDYLGGRPRLLVAA